MKRVFDSLPPPASPRATCTRPGTSPSPASATCPSACCTCATTPSPSSATTDLADRRVQGKSPEFTVDSVTDRTDSLDRLAAASPAPSGCGGSPGRVFVPNYLDRVQQLETQVGPQKLPFDVPLPGSRLLDTDRRRPAGPNPVAADVRVPYLCDVPLDAGPDLRDDVRPRPARHRAASSAT